VVGATLTSVSPANGSRGASVKITLTGTNLQGATSLTVTRTSGNGPTGITVSNFTPVNATTVTATLNISGNAANGQNAGRNIRVNTANNGNTNNVTFTVN